METQLKRMAATLLLVGLATVPTKAQVPTEPSPTLAMDRPRLDGPGLDGHDRSIGLLPGGPGRHRGPNHQPGPDRLNPRQFHRGLTSLTTLSGTVSQWSTNDDDILDGFSFTSSTNSSIAVKFPTHLGQQIQKSVKPGSSISVTGFTETTREGESRFRMTSLTAGKTTIVDTPPAAPTTPPSAPTLTTVTGKIADYRLGRDGRVNGMVLDDKTIIRIPPHVAYQLTNLAKKGSTITVQGYAKPLREGQVQLDKTTILNASVLSINGQQYLIR